MFLPPGCARFQKRGPAGLKPKPEPGRCPDPGAVALHPRGRGIKQPPPLWGIVDHRAASRVRAARLLALRSSPSPSRPRAAPEVVQVERDEPVPEPLTLRYRVVWRRPGGRVQISALRNYSVIFVTRYEISLYFVTPRDTMNHQPRRGQNHERPPRPWHHRRLRRPPGKP